LPNAGESVRIKTGPDQLTDLIVRSRHFAMSADEVNVTFIVTLATADDMAERIP
jgi:hypothetical protein